MNKAIFLDRDGTINIEKNYLCHIEEFEYIAGATDALKELHEAGFLLIIVTNQSGIARGYYTEEDFCNLNEWMLKDLNQKGIPIVDTYYCPHHPEAVIPKYRMNCDCRKPKLGLFQKAIQDFNIDVSQSYAIGDKPRDVSACKKWSIQGILLGEMTDKLNISKVLNIDKQLWFCSNLAEATARILGK